MKLNFIGNYQSGYVGEVADETHLARNLEQLGCKVQRVPRDVWKAWCDGEDNPEWKDRLPIKADANIICKWHHFDKEDYIDILRAESLAPVFYWVWDYMRNEEWHLKMVKACDVYLSNDVYSGNYKDFDNAYYFPFDVADEEIPTFEYKPKTAVAFFGSYVHQGDRIEWLKKINKECPVQIHAWNYQEWEKAGFNSTPALYGEEFNRAVARTAICLQFSVNDHTWGYWSNRVGKTLLAGGFLLARYAPGMELFLKDGVAYFNSPEEAIEKIKYYLKHEEEREKIRKRGEQIGQQHFTSYQRCKELILFIKNYLKRK